MHVLIGREFSGVVRDAFSRAGHYAMSCDLLASEGDPTGHHHQGSILEVLNHGWDLAIFHPPCTYLTVSGNRWYYHPEDKALPMKERRPHPNYPNRRTDRVAAIRFFMDLVNADIPRICVENPIGIMSTVFRKPDQIIQPWWFGHNESKATCLWLKGLPKLEPTNIIVSDGPRSNQTPSGQNKLGPSSERAKMRSKTYEGIAEAMSSQWGVFE